MELWVGAVNLGFLYAFMAMGVFITFRIHDFPDITVDGSFTAGAAAGAVLLASGYNPIIALLAAFVLGGIAGGVTALINTKFDINGLLAGILVMTGLYSINLHIMGRSNIPLLNEKTFVTYFEQINPGLPTEIWTMMLLFVVIIIFWMLISLFFKTDLGLSMRATGNNPTMTAAAGVNVNMMKIFGVALANGLVGFSGAGVAQYQGFADIGMGIGTIVIGLASVIIGESVFRMRSMAAKVASVIIGSVMFRIMIAFALYAGMNPLDLKLLIAVFVLATLVISKKVGGRNNPFAGFLESLKKSLAKNKLQYAVGCVIAIVLLGLGFNQYKNRNIIDGPKIGFIQIVDHGLLNITRDSFLEEMERIGYKNGVNCTIYVENANGDMPIVNSILDKFLNDNVDIIVPISTPCTQAAINKIKDLPIVFATVANPFIIGGGESVTDHKSNVTGVYGWVPMDQMLAYARDFLPGDIKIGAIWDPAHTNSVFNVGNLQKAAEADPGVTFLGQTITNSSEVFQAAVSLAQKDIDAFVLSPDNIVYSAFESIVKAAQSKKIPIFISDVERLGDGALGSLGYDYTQSGIQGAHLVDRVLKGENPKDIPFERYDKLIIGLNQIVADRDGITVPETARKKVTYLFDGKEQPKEKATNQEKKKIRVALVIFSDHPMMIEASDSVQHELLDGGHLDGFDVTVDLMNAQNEFSMAQSIAQDVVRQKYDYLVTLSTPVLQVCAQVNKTIPHIFGAVTDPYRMGVAKNPEDHIANITGVATLQPVGDTIAVMRELFPQAKKVGLIWNPAEACSEACTYKARETAKEHNFELLEVNVSNTSEVMDALKSLMNQDIDLFLTSGDNTVMLALESIAKYLSERKIPYFSNNFSDAEKGVFISIGADYIEVGKETAMMACKVINGESPASLPINNFAPAKMYVNNGLAKEFGITLSEEFLKRAKKVKE